MLNRFAGSQIDCDPRNLPYLPVLRFAGSVAQEQPELVERIKSTVLADGPFEPQAESAPQS